MKPRKTVTGGAMPIWAEEEMDGQLVLDSRYGSLASGLVTPGQKLRNKTP